MQTNGRVVNLPAGLSLPSTALVPPMVFSGHGNSRRLLPVDANNIEPRFGFAWRPTIFGLNGAGSRPLVIRGGYGISYVPLTGQDRNPNPDFGIPAQAFGIESGQKDPNYVMRLSSNPPNLIPIASAVTVPADGILMNESLRFRGDMGTVQAFAVAPDSVVGYVQSWNLTAARELARNTMLEVGYMGQKGTHLFMPPLNMNHRSSELTEALLGAGLSLTQAVRDPLGRTDSSGAVIDVTLGSVFTRYMGFDSLAQAFDSSATSIRHAGYVSIQKRGRGLMFTANYTFGKTIDDASAADYVSMSILPPAQSQINFGGARRLERSVAQYDIRHVFASTFAYELPFGRGGPRLVRAAAGGWSVSGVARQQSGLPLQATLSDTNSMLGFGGVRMNVVPGVPLLNPLWKRDCPVGNGCEPWFNPAAFMRPPKGQIGNAPRTFDGARNPWRQWLDLSVRKSFSLGGEGRRRIELRGQALNVLNHPSFLTNPNSGPKWGGAPNEGTITAANYNAWATYNGKPPASTPAGQALFTQANALITSSRVPGTQRLPADFFSIPVPQGFATASPNSFDITTLEGLKLYRLRNALAGNFGALSQPNTSAPRTIQFTLKFIF